MASPARIQSSILLTITKQVKYLRNVSKRATLSIHQARMLVLYSETVEKIRRARIEIAKEKWDALESAEVETLIKGWIKQNPSKLDKLLKEI